MIKLCHVTFTSQSYSSLSHAVSTKIYKLLDFIIRKEGNYLQVINGKQPSHLQLCHITTDDRLA